MDGDGEALNANGRHRMKDYWTYAVASTAVGWVPSDEPQEVRVSDCSHAGFEGVMFSEDG